MSVGITFRETMRGGFALDETDPQQGQARGQREGSELVLHAETLVPDVNRFIEDRDHAGAISGRVDFTPWGEGFAGSGGVFNLFKPAGDPGLRLMVYELGFEREGASYYLAGQKNVRDDLLRLWVETTTLYARLHQGSDTKGPVVGAGVLTLSVTDLIGVVSTLRATGASSKEEGAEAVSRFGSFFLGQLWDTYIKRAR